MFSGACPVTLLPLCVWDFHGVGQRTGHQRLAVEQGDAAGVSEPTLQPVGSPQSGVGGDDDVHLKERKVRRGGGRDEWSPAGGGRVVSAADEGQTRTCVY